MTLCKTLSGIMRVQTKVIFPQELLEGKALNHRSIYFTLLELTDSFKKTSIPHSVKIQKR